MVKINALTWLSLFIVYFIFDILYTLYVRAIQRCEALKTANLSVLILMLGFYGTVSYIDNPINVVPIILGSWGGAFLSIKVWKGRK